MNFYIKELKISELQNFINSEEYKNFDNIPISYHRAVSYFSNQRADKNDTALLLLFENNKLIAYRSFFSDYILINSFKKKVFWISGSWVHPKHRRKGYSTKLLNRANELFNNNLIFTNYAPNSKSMYDKTQNFKKVFETKGKRFYLRFSLSEILPPKHKIFRKIKSGLKLFDTFLNLLFDLRFVFFRYKIKNINFRIIEKFDEAVHNFIAKNNTENPFKRNVKEFIYFSEFSWILQKNQPEKSDEKYYFSSSAKRFFYEKVVFLNSKNQISGFLLLKIRNKNLSIPYSFFDKNEAKNITQFILNYSSKYRINYLTVFNPEIISNLKKKNALFLFSKNMIRDFFASKKLHKLLGYNKYTFFAGDGDNVFT